MGLVCSLLDLTLIATNKRKIGSHFKCLESFFSSKCQHNLILAVTLLINQTDPLISKLNELSNEPNK
jgi:hypothetical protein